jgi:hypothetical protein
MGIRDFKIADIAVFDVVATAFAGYLISTKIESSFIVVFICLIIVAIGIHWMFDIPTRGNAYLGLTTMEKVTASRRGS